MRIILVKGYTPSQQRLSYGLASAAADGGCTSREKGESEDAARASDATYFDSHVMAFHPKQAECLMESLGWTLVRRGGRRCGEHRVSTAGWCR